MKIILLLLFFMLAPSAHAQRLFPYAGPTTFYVDPVNGSDTTYTCLKTAPCKRLQFASAVIASAWDLLNQTITIQAWNSATNSPGCSGPFDYGPQLTGAYIGQTSGAGQITFIGDVSNADNCVIRPVAGNCFSAAYSAAYTITGFHCDMSVAKQDTIAVGQNATLVVKQPFTFGENLNPANDVTVASGGEIDFYGGYAIKKTTMNITASFSFDTNYLTVSSCAGISPNMVPHGPGLPPQTTVVDCTGNTMQISNWTNAALTNQPIAVSSGGQAHLDISNGGRAFYLSNCGQSSFAVSLVGTPSYYFSFIYVADLGNADLGATFTGAASGYKYVLDRNSVLNACGQASQIPGDAAGLVRSGSQLN